MTSTPHALLTVQLGPAEATIQAAARALGVEPRSIDPDFGVVPIDPKKGTYAVMVDERDLPRALRQEGVKGPFANPRIEPFGPPKP